MEIASPNFAATATLELYRYLVHYVFLRLYKHHQSACRWIDYGSRRRATQAAAGGLHTVLLKSDGTAAAFGGNGADQCNIPALPEGVTYTQAAAGGVHTVLLKSDGTAAAFGSNIYGQCNIPVLPASEGISYRRSGDQRLRTILTIEFGSRHAAFYMCSGEEVLRVKLNALDTLNDLRRRYVNGITGTSREFCAVLPTGEILEDLCAQTLTASLEPWLLRKRARLVE